MNQTIVFVIFQLLAIFRTQSTSSATEWRQEKGIFVVYGITLDKFLEIHPMTLLLIYDDSDLSKEALEMLPELKDEFLQNKINVVIAKMRKTDGPSWFHHWKAHHLPYFRFVIGNNVSVTLRSYPDQENLFTWVSNIYNTQTRIIEVRTPELKKRFHKEKNAFYLRFDLKKNNYYDLLTKLQMIDRNMQIYYSTNPAYDVFDNFNADDVVIGFKRDFEEPIKFLSSPDKLNADNIQRFFHSYREPKTVAIDENLLNRIMTERIRSAFFFGTNPQSTVKEAFIFVAFEQKQNILFVLIEEENEYVKEIRDYLNVGEKSQDEIRIIEHDGKDFKVYQVNGKTITEVANEFEKFNNKELQEIHQREEYVDEITGEL